MTKITGAATALLVALAGPALAGPALAGPALAQGNGAQTQTSPSAAQAGQPGSQQHASLVTANKIRQDLQNAGFSDVKVVAESFVIQAKSKDGDPVLMTVGPHGMSIFETLGSNDLKGADKTGSTNAAGTRAIKVSRLTDMNLYNAKGEVLGDVEQVVRGGDGHASIVIGHGGVLGLGEKQVAVPLDKVSMNGDRLVARGITDDQIKAMPAWTKGSGTPVNADQSVSVATSG
ncbi:PRC-barrel domain protein [Methylobacterium sp. 4-46]|uniref:PRC-barrel domain-containing protein n=1 Tax=unclassified Methylobacterium TaxID=2615210 RepID=UPI000152E602|nr:MULTISPECIES: PRC-barrel domain-containing protein [Methylobacterium]ACA20007.1 PRC-barrel domain protein [Methylobacterium sp. 4-46]WFT79194.1 PRC-barrel domain-containing protein [Methylobacterium nodulans]